MRGLGWDPNMPSPIRIALSSRLKLWKLLKNSGWFPGFIFQRGVFPLDEDFLDHAATKMSFVSIEELFGSEP